MNTPYDIDGQPIDSDEWWAHKNDRGYWRIAFTEGDTWDVSTVWTGMDMRLGAGAPLIFETMVFGYPCGEEHAWYPTRVAAELGHRMFVNRVLAQGGKR